MFRAATALALVLAAAPVLAQTEAPEATAAQVGIPEDIRAIHEALRLPELVAVLAEGGVTYGATLAESIFGTTPVPAEWTEMVAAIYDPVYTESEVLASMSESLAGEDTAAILQFLTAEPGQTLTGLELEARRAFADEEVEQRAREAAAVALADASPRLDLLRRYSEANDFVEANVASALNSNAAYLMGLMDGGAMPQEMTQSDILSDIWAQEPAIRADTTEWLYAFLLMAYEPASDGDIEALIAFSETDPGQALNNAVSAAFDQRNSEIARALGLAASRFLTTEAL